MKEITSISNPLIKNVRALKDKQERLSQGLFVVEGANIIKDLPSYVDVDSIFVEKSKVSQFQGILNKFNEEKIYLVDEKVMNVLSDTKTPCGILCLVKIQKQEFDESSNAVVLDGNTDPGNVGTIIRTCVACGVKNILAINTVDILSPKVVRSTMGGLFRVNVLNVSYDEALDILKNYNIITLDMKGENIYDMKEIKKPFALVIGSEAHGVSKELKDKCSTLISLPMKGDIESLNAAVSLSVALYHLSFSKHWNKG